MRNVVDEKRFICSELKCEIPAMWEYVNKKEEPPRVRVECDTLNGI